MPCSRIARIAATAAVAPVSVVIHGTSCSIAERRTARSSKNDSRPSGVYADINDTHAPDGREAALACPTTFVPVDAAIVGFVEQAVSKGTIIGRSALERA